MNALDFIFGRGRTVRWRFAGGPPQNAVKIGNRYYTSLYGFIRFTWAEFRGALVRIDTERNIAMGGCERCGSFWRLHRHPSMTAYVWDGVGENPNREGWFCEPCGEDYDEHWDAMWAEYNSGRL